ncbi:sulfotransferase family 2 domain-containing protein [Stappia sp. ES.058]|uniref:sulfotransferase family 2 domain-containing protein n=1 Tax=Stappia sp. ES.058 TaxID=1881061 RepID=UPI00087C5404|nr:sulfotransferase family 2 domain-containing protein [Stappia sp. ES.058]SDU00736.1 Sulfotransferase family protein [Stappia sp. ES.058]
MLHLDRREVQYRIEQCLTALGLRKPKSLFIHIPKNGGMSIRHAQQLKDRILISSRKRLKSKTYADSLLAAMNATGDHPGYEHARYIDVRPTVRKANNAFAIVRNPWSRVVSRYTFAIDAMDDGRAPEGYAPRDFEAFLEDRHVWGNREFFWHRAVRGWYPQLDYVVDENGKIAVDILTLENLSNELGKYFGMTDDIEKRNTSKTRKKNYKAFYNEKLIQIVADWYSDDIETFGFDFDTAATRNTFYV